MMWHAIPGNADIAIPWRHSVAFRLIAARWQVAVGPGTPLNGRYLVEEELGGGAFGTVWRCQDRELKRDVAIKVLHRQDEDSLKRFRREAEILAKLSHPAIATIHDIGTHDGRPFIVTELLDGTDLGKFISRHPRGMEVREVLDLAMPAAEALSYAHSRGVLHRDIKPGNLMVTGARRARGLRICDFGIASLASATWTLTAPGGFAGNPAYVSPEQLSGLADERSDLYSLGCVLYEMLTGHPPLTADSLVALLLMHVSTIPEPPESLEAIPDAFSALVLRMLAKNPGDRPRSANDVAAELGRIALLMRGLEVQPAERRCS
jgi:eukaryotic-like serine/threonine-protein kinase